MTLGIALSVARLCRNETCEKHPLPPSLRRGRGRWGMTRPLLPHSSSCLADNTSPKLREAEVKLIDYKICNSDKVYEGYLTPRMMCAGYLQGGKDACQVSWGHTRGQLPHFGYPQRVSCVPS